MKTTRLLILFGLITAAISLVMPDSARAQGSVFGAVMRSDMSTPENGMISFVGFVNLSDNELHISGSVGANYDAGFWFDNFQNYLNAPAGSPFTYFFYDTLAGESYRLQGLIDANGFQQEDIFLVPDDWPLAPEEVQLGRAYDGYVHLYWPVDSAVTVHIYRREITSEGSFFRIDDPTGLNDGIIGESFVDSTTDFSLGYTYLLLSIDSLGEFSPPTFLQITPGNCCGYYTGGYPGNCNAEPDGKRNIGDIVKLIDRIYVSKRILWCDPDGNASGDIEHKLNLADINRLIDLIFLSKAELDPCTP